LVLSEFGLINLQHNHAHFQVKVEWGIEGSKSKWRRLKRCLDLTKEKVNHLFKAITLLTNFLHKHRQNFTFEVIGEHQNE
jgi:hypothetical protein